MSKSHFAKEKDDTLKYGLYYVQHKKPGPDDDDTVAFATDSTVYINYIGRRLDGQVFDTNIRDTAKRYDIFSSSSKYEPVAVTWNKDDYKGAQDGCFVRVFRLVDDRRLRLCAMEDARP